MSSRPSTKHDGVAPGPVLFEVSTEVCNQVGGIYQVIRSKAPLMVGRWGERFCFVGPYEASRANVEFEPAPAHGWLAHALESLRAEGLRVHHGRWLVPGRPRALLIDCKPAGQELDALKYRTWSEHGIEFHSNDALLDMVIGFAEGVRRLLQAIVEHCPQRGLGNASGPVVANFHEWLGGLAIPMIRRQRLPIATVFTTHATVLGRALAPNTEDFSQRLPFFDPAAEAVRYGCATQHAIERAAAHGAHVFTTVSSVTAEECAFLLGRPVDVVTPNGLSIGLYNAGHEQQRLHGVFKEQIHRFTMGHFFPSYSFDLDRTLYFFTSGRYEPRNKGFDLCIESMARLNAELKAANLGKTVVLFIVTKRATESLDPRCMEKRGILNELEQCCRNITEGVGQRLFSRAASGGPPKMDDLIDEYWMLRYKRAQHAFRSAVPPPVITHELKEPDRDPVLNHIRVLGLSNSADDPVKVVYHPDFIAPTNRLWGMEYDQFVRGCHAGLFPSLYEPWGYTPLECAAMGVPSVTSDLAGFGSYVQQHIAEHEKAGLWVVNRRGRSFHESAAQMTRLLLDFCRLERRDRIALRNEVDRRSWEFDWNTLGTAYHTAHELSMARLRSELAASIPGRPTTAASTGAPTIGGVGAVSAAELLKLRKSPMPHPSAPVTLQPPPLPPTRSMAAPPSAALEAKPVSLPEIPSGRPRRGV